MHNTSKYKHKLIICLVVMHFSLNFIVQNQQHVTNHLIKKNPRLVSSYTLSIYNMHLFAK